jgi:hypothetical protein
MDPTSQVCLLPRHGCDSGTGSDRALADARCSSIPSVSPGPSWIAPSGRQRTRAERSDGAKQSSLVLIASLPAGRLKGGGPQRLERPVLAVRLAVSAPRPWPLHRNSSLRGPRRRGRGRVPLRRGPSRRVGPTRGCLAITASWRRLRGRGCPRANPRHPLTTAVG